MVATTSHIFSGKVDIASNLQVGSSHLFVDTENNRVGITTIDPHASLHVNGNVYAATNVIVGTDLTVTSNATVGADLTVTGNVSVSDGLTVTGNVSVSDDLTVTGNVLVSDDLTVTGNVLVSDDLTVTGNALVSDDLTVTGGVTSTTSRVSNVVTIGTTKTFVVTVQEVNSVNKYFIDGIDRPTLQLHQHQTYIFDLSSSTLSGHPFIFSETASGSSYDTGITSTGGYATTEKRTFVVPVSAPTTLYYYCTSHPGMGDTASISPTAELIVSGRVVASGTIEAVSFVGSGSQLTGITSNLDQIVNNGNVTSNTVQFTNATTGIVATGNVHALKFIGDGSQLTGITSNLNQIVNNGNVTSNTLLLTNATTGLVATGNVEASKFVGDGSLLTGLASNLHQVTENGNVTSNTLLLTNATTGLVATGNVHANYFMGDGSQLSNLPSGGVWDTNGDGEIYFTTSNVGISNADPGHNLSVGSNLYIDDDGSNVLVITGNAAMNALTLGQGQISIVPSYGLDDVLSESNISSNTMQLTNVTTGLVTTGNVSVGNDLTVTGDINFSGTFNQNGAPFASSPWTTTGADLSYTTGNVSVGKDLTMTGTGVLTVPSGTTAQRPGTAANGMMRYNTETGSVEAYTANSGWGAISSPPSITSVLPTSVLGANTANTTFVVTGVGITPGSTVQLEGADGTLYSVFNTTTPAAAGYQISFNMGVFGAANGYDPLQTPYKIRVANAMGIAAVGTATISLPPPTITSLSNNTLLASATGSTTITVTGTGFTSSMTGTDKVQVLGVDGTTLYPVDSVAFVDATSLTFKLSATGVALTSGQLANRPYKVKVTGGGLTATSTATIGFSGLSWTSPAAGATLTTFLTTVSANNTELAATDDVGGSGVTYSIPANNLPSGLSLIGSTGAITGLIAAATAAGGVSVTFRVTDNVTGAFAERTFSIVGVAPLYTMASPFTFTNANVLGRTGPTISQLRNAYSSDNWTHANASGGPFLVASTQGIQEWTVPVSGTYRITAVGARGGEGGYGPYTTGPWRGSGASMRGDFSLTQGDIIKILVGQMGHTGTGSYVGSGGGGSYVATYSNTALIVAGGGGAGYPTNVNQGLSQSGGDAHASITTTGHSGSHSNDISGNHTQGSGVSNGNGGSSGNGGYMGRLTGGGGGFLTNGYGAYGSGAIPGDSATNTGYGGYAFVNGGVGGEGNSGGGSLACNSQSLGVVNGGFGGGSGGSYAANGAGGGYSGGGGTNGCQPGPGGGGGSINTGTNQVNTYNANANNHGSVTIQKL